jgi:hypothetical protein
MAVRELTVDVVRSFQRNGLANFASAMAFRVILALVPFLLFLLALTGFLDLEEIWRSDVAPELKKSVSDAAYRLISDTVEQVLSQKQVWWLTAGLLLTLWELDGVLAVLSFLIRWLLAACVLAVGVGLLVRLGPGASQPLPWGQPGHRPGARRLGADLDRLRPLRDLLTSRSSDTWPRSSWC